MEALRYSPLRAMGERMAETADARRGEESAALLYEFGPFVLRLSDRTLFRGAERVRITPRVLDLLACLVETPGRVVTKEQLLDRVWEGTFVEEGNVNRTVSTLRKLLEESGETSYIETIPRQGYRFVVPVRKSLEPAAAPVGGARGPATVAEPELAEGPAFPSPALPSPPASAPPPATAPTIVTPPAAPRWRRRAVLGAALAILGALAVAGLRSRPPESPRSLAVLPFRFSAGAANGETLGVALADAVIGRLSRGESLVVRPTTAILPFRAGKTDPMEVAERLHVDAVLDSEVSQKGGRTRVSLRLLRRHDGKPLHVETFETGPATLFDLQDRVAERVSAALLVPLAPPSTRRDAARLAASDLLLRARKTAVEAVAAGEALDEAIGLYRRAIEADPDLAPAYVGLADALVARSPGAAEEAEESARRALAIDDRLGPAHASIGRIRMVRGAPGVEVEADLSRALALEPSYAPAWEWMGTYLLATGRAAEARTALARAVELDPTSVTALCEAGRAALVQGNPLEARGLLSRARSGAPRAPAVAALEKALRDSTGW